MSMFSEKLSQFIVNSGLTLVFLAKNSGFEASYITKMKKGERLPQNRDKLLKLIDTLQLSPTDQADLLEAYEISCIGEKYKCYIATKSLIENAEYNKKVEIKNTVQYQENKIHVMQGENNINNILKMVVESACAYENGFIKMITPTSTNFLTQLLATTIINNCTIPVTHIIPLRPAERQYDAIIHNIRCIEEYLPVLMSEGSYHPKYYYDKSSADLENCIALPNVILTSHFLLHISADYKRGTLQTNSDMLSFYDELFEKQIHLCKDLGKTISSLLGLLNYNKDLVSCAHTECYYIGYQPCLLPFLTEKDAYQLISDDMPDKEQLITQYFTQYMQNFKNGYQWHSIFTLEGVQEFIQTGRLLELPPKYVLPLPKDIRRRMLRDLLNAAERGFYHPYIVKNDKLQIPQNLSVDCFGCGQIGFLSIDVKKDKSCFAIDEYSVATAMYDFARFLTSSNWVYTKEESVERIRNLIK